jgi:hypothetical protein
MHGQDASVGAMRPQDPVAGSLALAIIFRIFRGRNVPTQEILRLLEIPREPEISSILTRAAEM